MIAQLKVAMPELAMPEKTVLRVLQRPMVMPAKFGPLGHDGGV